MQNLINTDQNVEVKSTIDIVTARQKGRELALEMRFSGSDVTLIAAAVSEIARYILDHAKKGIITFSVIEKKGQFGLQILAEEQGSANPEHTPDLPSQSPARSYNCVGIQELKSIMDDFELDSRTDGGTRITMRKWRKGKRPHLNQRKG